MLVLVDTIFELLLSSNEALLYCVSVFTNLVCLSNEQLLLI